jgi:thiamine biosynthesis protein ThiS
LRGSAARPILLAIVPELPEIEIRLNGERRRVRAGASVAQLMAELALAPERVAVERNRHLVRRSELAATALESGDELEIVTLVGGG